MQKLFLALSTLLVADVPAQFYSAGVGAFHLPASTAPLPGRAGHRGAAERSGAHDDRQPGEPHPMHPHGHAVLVLARDGRPASGPLWMDSSEVGPGEVWKVALRADSPGLWMNHCHNLEHAVAGMVGHLAYEGVSTPFAVGIATGNHPE